jgi:Lrp/AsnC family transcriptional regulator, leucine-responsive regulatory protein
MCVLLVVTQELLSNWYKITVFDTIDIQILSELRGNGRASYAALGAAVGLSPHGAADRVRRLERNGTITGYAAILDMPKVGRGLDAVVDVRLLTTTEPEHFERFCSELPAVQEVAFMTGRFDYLVRVACADADDLDQTVRKIRRQGGAAATETRIVLRAATIERRLT